MSRHYREQHADELIVQELAGTIASKRKKGFKRMEQQAFRDEVLGYLANQARAQHNLSDGIDDPFYCARRPRTDKVLSDFVMCAICEIWLARSSAHKHKDNCKHNKDGPKKSSSLIRLIMGKANEEIKDLLQIVLSKMNDGEIKTTVVNDMLLVIDRLHS